MNETSTATWTGEIRQGNKRAFEQVFKTYYSRLCLFALKYLGDEASAEEVVQDLFLRIWEKRHQIEIETSLKAYLYRAVRNSCLNELKHQQVEQNYRAHQQQVADDYEEMPDPELGQRIHQAIEKLPENHREVFTMNRFEGLRYKDIAEKLGISVKTVESYMTKSLKFLRKELVDYLPVVLALFLEWVQRFLK